MDREQVIGIIASTGTAVSLLPQLIKIIKEKKAEGTSPVMLIVLFTGLGFWITYGVLKNDWIIISANTISFLLNLAMGILAIKYRPKQGTPIEK